MSPPAVPVADPEGARRVAEIIALIDALEPVLEQETVLVRAGRLADAATLQARKTELAAGYLRASRQIKADAARLPAAARASLAAARDRHDRLRALLQMNMTVVATAHAVAEGLIRGAAAEATRRAAPQTYGAGGRPSEVSPRDVRPVALNRNC
jgi:hypothetical protein